MLRTLKSYFCGQDGPGNSMRRLQPRNIYNMSAPPQMGNPGMKGELRLSNTWST